MENLDLKDKYYKSLITSKIAENLVLKDKTSETTFSAKSSFHRDFKTKVDLEIDA